MAIPTYQAINTSSAGAADNTVAWPTHQSGDFALLCVETANEAVTLSTTGGFTQITGSPQSDTSSSATRLTVFSCLATSSSMTSPVIQNPGNHSYAVIITFRGVNQSTPINISAGNSGIGGGSTSNCTTVTTTVNDCLIALLTARGRDSTDMQSTSASNANLANITQRNNAGTTNGNGGGIVIYTADFATAGATGTSTINYSASPLSYGAITVAIAPAASGPANVKTVDGLAIASVKTVDDLAIASVKTINGLN